MPTADYKLSGVHTADTQSLKDRLEAFSRNVGGNITGAVSSVRQRAPAFDRRSSMLEQPPVFMRLIAAYKALVDGKVPTNEQLEDMMDAVAKEKNIRGVSGDGMECFEGS
ncbi:hypothetical protein BC829DRAFT_436896 [Chytridium lagenaria]|nr:hypothetical protein BC829DRAFT_436896 [Chytridium lagenaria]